MEDTNEIKPERITSATRQVRRLVVFGRRLSARFPCPAGQEIARNPPLRVASYVVWAVLLRLKGILVLVNYWFPVLDRTSEPRTEKCRSDRR